MTQEEKTTQSAKGTILWGLTSSIALYKSLEAIRFFVRDGYRVIPILSRSALQFIQPLLLETLTGEHVYTDVMKLTSDHRVAHVALARESQLFVIAPASAHCLSALANGLAHDMITTTYLAFDGFVLLAPAMNVHMWRHPAVQNNCQILRARGDTIIEPDTGAQIDGDYGPGRLASLERLISTVRTYLERTQVLKGQTVLVTAGPTREYIDPVRFITNASSGKMGFALAESAHRRGAHVILITGPTSLIPHPEWTCIQVETTEDMFHAVLKYAEKAQWIIKAAAPADYKPKHRSEKKMKKDQDYVLELERTPDILLHLGQNKKEGQRLIGFSAETHQHEQFALEKLKEKNLDYIVLNHVEKPERGFASETNEVIVFDKRKHSWSSPLLSKRELAEWLWNIWLHGHEE